MQYTKQPWVVTDGRSIETKDGRRIAHNYYRRLCGSSQAIPPEEVFGNAQLIALAPELMDACQGLLQYWHRNNAMTIQIEKVQDHIDKIKRLLLKSGFTIERSRP